MQETHALSPDTLSLFYEEPDSDRWLPLDRYLRRAIRRIIRGKPRAGGHARVFLNLCAGLDKLGVRYRVNDYAYIKQHPHEIACIIGKPHVLDKIKWANPILFGAAVFSHPLEQPGFFQKYPTVRKILVPGDWMRKMWDPYFGDKVKSWAVGVDTDLWSPSSNEEKRFDFLLYDKVMWHHEEYERTLLDPIRAELRRRKRSFSEIRYGYYHEEEFHELLQQCRAMIFLCEHETQGIAYQQALSCGVPILAWDRAGYWQDPSFYPDKVKYGPVSSVPYWNERCGVKFCDSGEFEKALLEFVSKLSANSLAPREYILNNLSLEKCARHYLDIFQSLS